MSTISHNDTFPEAVSINTVFAIMLSTFTIKVVEPDYVKAWLIFSGYWGVYFLSIWVYYQSYKMYPLMLYISIFWLVYELYKQNYDFTDSIIDISYDFDNDPAIILDGNNRIKANKKFSKIFSSFDEFKFTSHYTQILWEIKNPNNIELQKFESECEDKISIQQILDNKEEYLGKSFSILYKNEEKVLSFTVVTLENVYDTKTILMFRDTTQAHNLEKEKSDSKYKSVLMGCLTHELRTPVNLVISGLHSLQHQMVSRQIISDECDKLFKIWVGSVEMLKNLIEDFIDFTLINTDNPLNILKENVNLRKLFESIKDLYEVQTNEKRIAFNIDISQEVPVIFKTDSVRLKQVILNLLSNALKFTPNGSITIEVVMDKRPFSDRRPLVVEESKQWDTFSKPLSLRNPISKLSKSSSFHLVFAQKNNWSQYLHIKIKDTGIGMSQNETKSLFQKFKVCDSSRNMNRNGLGLGLYLSKQIIVMLGGDVYWESQIGIGTTFTIEFAIDPKADIFSLKLKRSVMT